MADTVGMADLRAEDISSLVTGFALQSYKFKDICMIKKGSAWTDSYYQETATELSAKGTRNIKGIGRLSEFPSGEVAETLVQARIQKYGMEGVISYEDIKFNNIDVLARTLLRIGRAIAKSVDDEIFVIISENHNAVNINYVAATAVWTDTTNGNPISDALAGVQAIEEYNYDMTSGGVWLLSPKDYKNVLTWTWAKGAQAPKIAESIGENGFVKSRSLAGLKLIVSNSVLADYSLIAKAKDCATWVEAVPLTVVVIDDPGVKKTVRGWELGKTELKNPRAVALISNTQ